MQLTKPYIYKHISSVLKRFSIHTSHPVIPLTLKRVLSKEKHYVFYELTQSKTTLKRTNDILNKGSVKEAIP